MSRRRRDATAATQTSAVCTIIFSYKTGGATFVYYIVAIWILFHFSSIFSPFVCAIHLAQAPVPLQKCSVYVLQKAEHLFNVRRRNLFCYSHSLCGTLGAKMLTALIPCRVVLVQEQTHIRSLARFTLGRSLAPQICRLLVFCACSKL